MLRFSGRLLFVVSVILLVVACGRTDLETFTSAEGSGDEWGVNADAGETSDTVSCDDGREPTAELCDNGVDEDCDGVADDGCACDFNGQAEGVCQNGTISETDGSCLEPDFYESSETLCDGRDNDCNGLTDENCTCVEGETQPCYNGPAGSEGIGICQSGTLACEGDSFSGTCSGEITPSTETCNSVDDDCDGATDEGCSCAFDGNETGVCSDAVVDAFGACQAPADYQETEISCDGLDNDCDGVVDESCGCAFQGKTDGVCSGGVVSPEDGSCEAPDDFESDETSCDGKDNDCDGSTDEDCECSEGDTRTCYDGPDGTADVGQCQSGQQTCVDGFYGGGCEGQMTPQTETCNGLDDDCDGVIDEGCPCDFNGQSAGVCANGVRNADGECMEPTAYESDESTCDGRDNDCDGVVDEGCSCNFSGTAAGVCSDGTLDSGGTCTAPSTYESDESTCDSLDNDCDGATDEGCPCDFRESGQGVCGEAVRNNGGQCKPPRGFTGREAHCNDGIDNDCNGQTDCDDPACARRGTCR